MASDRGSRHSSGDSDDESNQWESWASELGDAPIRSLLSDSMLPSAEAAWAELEAATGFSYDSLIHGRGWAGTALTR